LYSAVTSYVIKGFNSAKRTKNNATGLIMILFQRLVSSSTAAILSAMEGRLDRLRYGEDNNIDNYANEFDNGVVDYDQTVDFENIYHAAGEGFADEETLLCDLIEQAKECMQTEIDAKADALLKKYKELQIEANDKDLKILIFTEFRTTQKMLFEFFKSNGYSCDVINGSQDLDTRQIALADFKNKSQILIGTDAAGESLNMQFCHIIVNYDLPWNPMMIEQRIGRVDRIGQKNIVKAYNMLTNNSVDLRVYEVIEEKLNNILEQLGIDKTSDVLDSTLDVKKINQLYLQSLLDPSKFEFAGDKWLHEIKSKLKDFQSTEGVLPQVKEDEINIKKAAEIKYSPLPQWLEELITEYTKVHQGTLSKNLLNFIDVKVNGVHKKITFDAEAALMNPGIEHITLQHDWIKTLLSDISSVDNNKEIPVLQSNQNDETSGYWSLWEITAKNQFDKKVHYQCFFIADNGKQYAAYANDIWNRLISQDGSTLFKVKEMTSFIKDIEKELNEALYIVFQNLEADVSEKMKFKKENKMNSYSFQKSRINKIGIENIKLSKLSKLERENENWMKEFQTNRKIIPGTKQILTIRIDG
jgi:hypothetical protein